MSFSSLSPLLKQPFFIGDGLTGNGSGSVQQFIVPAGATRLFLASGDAFGWYNNTGSFTLDVVAVPEPASLSLTALRGAALIALAWWRRAQHHRRLLDLRRRGSRLSW
ncbi:MAG TPA: hypothetical protein VKM54_00015 [Myxococcota bacterium]|nr:hypothetical protein [Myxococcota bacterium]